MVARTIKAIKLVDDHGTTRPNGAILEKMHGLCKSTLFT